MSSRSPPRYVPTLTEVVQPAPQERPYAAAGAISQDQINFSQDQIIHRVMQRIDLVLERRLREAVATTVIEQTRTIAPTLRKEIEAVVRETVEQAFAEELAAADQKR